MRISMLNSLSFTAIRLPEIRMINVCLESVAHVGMTFNATKSMTMMFQPYKAARRVLCTFTSFKLSGVELTVVREF